ncbi:MAG TPA: hypothetical protein VE978_00770 [Chitinophagales bacterium]|nr:hypothetical protein [Chitinophagales bacterium]
MAISRKKIKAFIRKAQAPHIIPGIHNYCDRWCERCAFQMRCNVGIAEAERATKSTGDMEADMEAAMKEVAENFEMTMEMIKMDAERLNIDLNAIEEDEEVNRSFEERQKREEEFLDQSPLKTLAHDYGMKVHDWIKSESEIFKGKGEELSSHLLMGISSEEEAMRVVNEMKDAIETIQWFELFIEVKFSRALSGLFDVIEGEDDDEAQSDHNGSAKIALIAVDRSMSAWEIMMKHFPDKADDMLDFVALLSRIKSAGNESFPIAMKFIRPGFDEPGK